MKENIFKSNYKKYLEIDLTPYPAEGKRPIYKWNAGLPTPEGYAFWEEMDPDANIWVLLGDKFAVIDPVGPGAEEFVKSLDLPKCPTSISGNRSVHRWFKLPSPIKHIKASNGPEQTFLELRTGKMGMLAPPSIHPETGREYKWAEGLSPWEIPFPELPMEVYEKMYVVSQDWTDGVDFSLHF